MISMLSRLALGTAGIALLVVGPAGCPDEGPADDDTAGGGDCGLDCPQRIESILVPDEVVSIPYYGDLWSNSWSADGKLYLSWGDGTGLPGCAPSHDGVLPGAWGDWTTEEDPTQPGCFWLAHPSGDLQQELFCDLFGCDAQCFPLCAYTDAGLLALGGTVPEFDACSGEDCIVARHIPTPETPPVGEDGSVQKDHKTSSMLFVGDRLYIASHTPAGEPELGFLAYSDDGGLSWTETQASSPWGASSPFRVAMFVNMGQAYELNEDGYVYAMGVPHELAASPMSVVLGRVPVGSVADHGQWTVLAGFDGSGQPIWSSDASGAVAMEGLQTQCQGSAMYHPGAERYLFLTGVETFDSGQGALYEAVHPWGPWIRVGDIPGTNISSLVAKGAGDDFVFYTAAGGTSPYNLNIRAITMALAP
jgi:hypothetical protein